MTTLTLKAPTPTCGHLHVTISLNGVERSTVSITTEDVSGPPNDEDLKSAVSVLLRAYKVGRTIAQVRNAVISASGIEVVL